jgi:hypothetical protein
MSSERFHKDRKSVSTLDVNNSFIQVDSAAFNRPVTISLATVGDALQIRINEDFLEKRNVVSVESAGQDISPGLPPDAFSLSSPLHLAADENYLYVWIPKLSKWKRLLLSDWNRLDS